MGLLKGAQIVFTDANAIIGDRVITAAEQAISEAQVTVPHAPLQEGDSSWDEPAGFADLESSVPEAQVSHGALAPILADYEAERDHLRATALGATEWESNGLGREIDETAQLYLEDQLASTRQELLEANPEANFDLVEPQVTRHVAAQLELLRVGLAAEARWSHLQRIEKQVLEDTAALAEGLEAGHGADSLQALLSDRERILSEARLEAERQILEAHTRAAQIAAQAEQIATVALKQVEGERERILAEMRQSAYQEGYQEGKLAGDRDAARYVQEAWQMANEMAVALPAAVKQNEDKLVVLALEIARKVIQQEIALQPEIIQRTVETALRRVSDLDQVTLKVNPLDLDLVLPKQETFKSIIPDVQNFSIEGNHTIQRGGCTVETNSGSINATIEMQLSILEELFRNIRAEYEDEVIGEMG